MFRTPSLVFPALLLMGSVTAFAGDTPDPSSKGEAALPSGSNAATPPSTHPCRDGCEKRSRFQGGHGSLSQ